MSTVGDQPAEEWAEQQAEHETDPQAQYQVEPLAENLIERLAQRAFSGADLAALLTLEEPAAVAQLHRAAYDLTTHEVGDAVYYRGLIELSNRCIRDCYYCGIRRGNHAVERYTLDQEAVVEAAVWAAHAGYGSCVLQAGERQDEPFTAFIEACVRDIKQQTRSAQLPQGLGITLSLGEQSAETYQRWREAGAHRYLLRIETSSPTLFARLHPPEQRFERRLKALEDLAACGFQVGTGVMIGLPGQTIADLVADIRFFASHAIDMIGMGPYLTASGNAMPDSDAATMAPERLLTLTLNMIATTRLVLRDVNIAATTALQTLVPDGRERGIACGANIVMPNITPTVARSHYQLYVGKPCLDEGREACRGCLERRIRAVGRRVGRDAWGDSKHYARRL
ncbi:[FeFe] hydrogenase H-cluster radical SAM maturase HydE [Halorhodospira abdelmalekii]|uniref:[FeFe] hydrogenase H-cluster radical SAM maturase HydE n=1 Tax=Halorhodospira abdelmalekii TaxID=421629 RepID=UPI001908C625|nr:[FeFe] hydrogenase H-cluster radical SAM maturase HydE [Halorhodospira abdelmalekii]MBK1735433.1 [FeFe] hydrogenase H-cluster radical SAM maturase HydE [Halorhodospira abdelmalekii]